LFQLERLAAVAGCCGWLLWLAAMAGCCGWLPWLAAVAGCCGWLLCFIIKERGSPVSLHVHHQQFMYLPLCDDLEQLLLLLLLLLQGISTAMCYMNCWRAMFMLVLAVY
jgi:hypothetical protein